MRNSRHTSGCLPKVEVEDSTGVRGKAGRSLGGYLCWVNPCPRQLFRLAAAVLLLLVAASFLAQADGASGDGKSLQDAGVEDGGLLPVNVSSDMVTRSTTSVAVAGGSHGFGSYGGGVSGTQRDELEGVSFTTEGFRLSTGSGGEGVYGTKVNITEEGTGAVKIEEERDDLVRFTLVNASGLEEIYFVFEPEGWESARSFEGLEEGISITLRTEASARRLLESEEKEEVRIPDGLDLGFDGFSVESREAAEVEEVTCLYDHNGYTFRGVRVPAEIDIPCHAPKYREAESINEGTGVPISLNEGEYRFIGKIDGKETVLRSYTVDNVEEDNTSSAEGDPGTGTGADRTEENGVEEAQPLSLRDVGRYLGMAAAGLVVFSVLVAFSLLGGRKLKGEDRDEDESSEEKELLSNEERVLRELERNDGRMKQQTLVESLGWTEAKTSQVVNDMHDEERVDKYRLGRENVLALPEEGKEDDEEI